MISFRLRHQPLDLYDNASYAVEGRSPLFAAQAIPGTRVYSFNVPITKNNRRTFRFAERIGALNPPQQVFPDAELYLFGTQWRRGTLRLREANRDSYSLSFHTDAGDLAARIQKARLTDLDLGTDVLNLNADPEAIYPQRNYALFPVKNPAFYGDINPAYGGYLNDYLAGAFQRNQGENKHAITPFPFLLYVLNRVAQQLGYLGVSGPWTEEEDVRRLVIYNTFALDELFGGINTYASKITYANHVPEMEVGKFLIAIKNLFGLAIFINPRTKYLEFVRLTDVLANPAFTDYSPRATESHTLTPNENEGFVLGLGQDSGDELYKTLAYSDQSYRTGEGAVRRAGESFATPAGTLFETRTEHAGREWTVPQAEQAGNSPAYLKEEGSLALSNKFSLRLIFYRGLQPDSQGGYYPQGGRQSGTPVGDHYKLSYTGPNGLYERCYRPWLDFLATTTQVETSFRLRAPEVLSFDFQRKIMRQHVKYFVRDYKLSITRNGIRPASMTLQKVRV